MRLTREEKQLRTMQRAQKIQRWIDPAAATNQVSVFDAAGGAAGNLRTAERENKNLRLLEDLLAEQRQTNHLLAQLLAAQAPRSTTGGHQFG